MLAIFTLKKFTGIIKSLSIRSISMNGFNSGSDSPFATIGLIIISNDMFDLFLCALYKMKTRM